MNDKNQAYPNRPPKKYPNPDLHGRVRWCNIPYENINRAIKFFTDVFDWDFVDTSAAPPGGNYDKRFLYGASGPSQPGREGSVPGYVNFSLLSPDLAKYYGLFFDDINHPDGTTKVGALMEVHMDEPITVTLDKVVKYGGKVVKVDEAALRDDLEAANWSMSAVISDPNGHLFNLWRCPSSRTWEEPEAGYDKD
ncbi:MAG: hypothetical protein Q4C01_03445 [Clostridia bacterium]|nr:hypothetical protein [Clostridia bacterium]